MSTSIDYDADGYPIFPFNEKGMPVLPKDSRDQPFFPLDDHELPIFPFDKVKKRWTFPVDDTEEPIFPRNAFNKPIVPVDENDCPIFPVDDKGEFIFPLDESNCPIPALRPDGQPVIPRDEYGNFVIPKDRKGKPLIHITDDGVTPMSLSDWKQWKQYCRANKAYLHEVQQQQQMQAAQQQQQAAANYSANGMQMSMIFHPLNLEHNAMSRASELAMLQRTKRVRPEDIDLPMPGAVDMVMDPSMIDMAGYYEYYGMDGGAGSMDDGYAAYANGGDTANGAENAAASSATAGADPLTEKALKRKKFLAAQLNFSKKLPVRQTEKEQKLDNCDSVNSDPKAKLSEPSATLSKNIKLEKDFVGEHPADNEQFEKQPPKTNNVKMETPKAFLSYDDGDKRNNDDAIRADAKENMSGKAECVGGGRKRIELNFATTKTDNSFLAKEVKERSERSHHHSKEKKHSSSTKKEKHRHRSRHHSSRSRHGSCGEDNGGQQDVKRRRASKSCVSNDASSFDATATDYSEYDVRSLNENSELNLVRRCIKHTRRKYDSIKEQIAALEEQRAVQRQKLKRLFKVESLVEKRLGIEYLSSSTSPAASGDNDSSGSSSSDEESDYRGGRSK